MAHKSIDDRARDAVEEFVKQLRDRAPLGHRAIASDRRARKAGR